MDNLRPLIYVAGPITNDPWGCVKRATEIADSFNLHGVDAYLPQLSVLHEMVDSQPYEYWISHGLNMVSRCDGLYRMPGESPGAEKEVAFAKKLNLPCFDEHDGDEIVLLSDWLDAAAANYRNEYR